MVAGRTRLEAVLRDAGRALTVARALDGEEVLEGLALAAGRDAPVRVERRAIWGIPTAKVTAPALVRAADARGTALTAWPRAGIEAARLHERALEVMLEISTRELELRRIGEEIRATSRRINALERVVLPRLGQEIARVDAALEERAREDVVRLRRLVASRGGALGARARGLSPRRSGAR